LEEIKLNLGLFQLTSFEHKIFFQNFREGMGNGKWKIQCPFNVEQSPQQTLPLSPNVHFFTFSLLQTPVRAAACAMQVSALIISSRKITLLL